MGESTELGARLREVRLARGHSLRATAAAAQISPSLLSQVETGKVQPSVSTLYAVVSFLGYSLDEIMGTLPDGPVGQAVPADRSPVLRAGAGMRITMENGVTWDRLATLGGSPDIDPLLTTYAPHGSSSVDDTHMRHGGIEHGFIIRGELTLKLEFDSYLLRAGDSVCFDAERPHLYVNHTDAETQGVWFVVGHTQADPGASPEAPVRTAVDVLHAMKARERGARPVG